MRRGSSGIASRSPILPKVWTPGASPQTWQVDTVHEYERARRAQLRQDRKKILIWFLTFAAFAAIVIALFGTLANPR